MRSQYKVLTEKYEVVIEGTYNALSPEKIKELIDVYTKALKDRDIPNLRLDNLAKRFGVNQSAIYNQLRKNNITLSSLPKQYGIFYQYNLKEPLTDREQRLINILLQDKKFIYKWQDLSEFNSDKIVDEINLARGKASYQGIINDEQNKKLNDALSLVRDTLSRQDPSAREKARQYSINYRQKNYAKVRASDNKARKIKQQITAQEVNAGKWTSWAETLVKRKWAEYPDSDPKNNPENGITIEYVLSKGVWPPDNKCPITGKEFSLRPSILTDDNTEQYWDSPEIDRIIPGKSGGKYEVGNIAIISKRANSIKRDHTKEEIKIVARWLEKALTGDRTPINESVVNGVELPQKVINWIIKVYAKKTKAGYNTPLKKINDYTTRQLEVFKNEVFPLYGHLSQLDSKIKKKIDHMIFFYEENQKMLQDYDAGDFRLYIKERMMVSAARRADLRVTVEDILKVFPKDKLCPVFHTPMRPNINLQQGRSIGPSENSPSLDKLNPKLGYIPGNIAVISNKANTIKLDCIPAELYAVAKYMEDQERYAFDYAGGDYKDRYTIDENT